MPDRAKAGYEMMHVRSYKSELSVIGQGKREVLEYRRSASDYLLELCTQVLALG